MQMVALLSGFSFDHHPPLLVISRLRAPRRAKDWPEGVDLTIESFTDDDVAPVLSELEQVVLERLPAERMLTDPDVNVESALWLGGAADEVGAPDWRDRIQAVGMARGIVIDVIEQPARRFAQARERINRFAGAAVLLWVPFCGPNYAAFLSGLEGTTPILLGNPRIEDALCEAQNALDGLETPDEDTDTRARVLPTSGETRHYKKHYARRGGGDRMVDRGDCKHNAWVGASGSAPQAELGIEKLEQGTPWSRVEKCVKCTGGGVWRVTY